MTTQSQAGDADTRGAPGTVIAERYTLRTSIGSGGMGTVWRAFDDLLRRDVAIKEVVLPPGVPPADRDALIERTLREARAAAALNHACVVRVYDVVTDAGRPWIVMELLDARSLAEIIESDGALPPRAVAKIGLAMLGALEAAHAAGILHRDVKPGNVLICRDGRCVLTDFGVARTPTDGELTAPGMVLGSPHYISPERALGNPFGPPSDLFSLGVTLYSAIEGRPPFDRGDPMDTMHAVVHQPAEPPGRATELAPVVLGLLAKDPAQRWDAARAREALRALLLGPLASGPVEHETDPQAVMRQPVAPAVPVPPAQRPATAPASPAPASPAPIVAAPLPPLSIPPQPGPPQPGPPPPMPMPVAMPPRATGPPHGGPPGPRRPAGPWVFGTVAAVAALLIVIAAVGGAAGWFDSGNEPRRAGPGPSAAASAPFDVEVYTDERGFTVNVPRGWKQQRGGNFVNFVHPEDPDTWIRFNVENTSVSDATKFLENAERGLQRNGKYRDYQRVGLQPVQLGGRDGSELAYALNVKQSGQQRRGLWRVTIAEGRAYQVYLSVPQERFEASRPIFDEAVRSYQLGA